MALPRPASPRTLWADLKAFLVEQDKQKILIGLAAAMMPVIIVTGFILDTRTGITNNSLKIVYVESWPADRPDDVIKKQNAIDQKKRDAILLERRRGYQRLAKSLGIDY
jgi:hypothetical protein